jgi:two-component system, LytTR family, sensor kinase
MHFALKSKMSTFLEHYVEIQKQRFQERLIVRFHMAPDMLLIPVPTLLLQPLVENAIHHGIGRYKGSDVVEITARREGQQLVLEIRNSASSLLDESSSSGHSVGLKNMRARQEPRQACIRSESTHRAFACRLSGTFCNDMNEV